MAMIRIQRRLFSASDTVSASLLSSSSSSASRLRPSMAFEYKALHSSRESCLPCLRFGTGEKYRNSSIIRFRKVRLSCAVRSSGLNLRAFDLGSSLSLPVYGAFTKRFYSKVEGASSKLENTSVGGGKRGKNRDRAKPLGAKSKSKEVGSTSSSSKAIDLDASSEVASSASISSPKSNSDDVSKVAKKKPRAKKSPKKDGTDKSTVKVNVAQEEADTSPVSKSKLKINGDTTSSTELVPEKKTGKRKTAKAEKVGRVKPLGIASLKPLYPPTGKSVVVVESVTKAKVIQGYLGDKYEVLPSYGHVRDLAGRSGSVRPDDDFSMVWEVPSAAWTHLKSIKVALNGAQNLILASDPDREGEAISWHIFEMLQQQDALHKGLTVARVVFHEITEPSIKKALTTPREINENLVHAYLARRALDYLIGFNISPLLWRKLPGCQSAGRVQSAALALICDREMEIDQFKPQEYWTVKIELNKKELGSEDNASSLPAHLTHYNSEKLDQLSISSEKEAKDIENEVHSINFKVVGYKTSKVRRNPPTPFITSTLQQDAANKLHFSSTYTMKLAQKLYEGIQLPDGRSTGLITYTRTDGVHISDEAVNNIRSLISERYGQDFAATGAQKHYKKVKNAQEAHEAIRPTDISRLPSMLSEILDKDALKLYTLIWCRTVACQMTPASIKQIHADIGNPSKSVVFRSSCSSIEFLGYQAVFKDVEAEAIGPNKNEGIDRIEVSKILESLKTGDQLSLREVQLTEHHTQPPSRFSEGSLVKKMEELGIGRPSTYASTLKVLQDRNYLTVKSRVLHPEFRGRMVSAFLNNHFTEVTDYSFTADMENELDNVSAGLTEWKGLLRDYWSRFSAYCETANSIHIHQVEKMLEKTFGDFLFASLPDENRTCPSCLEGTLIFKVSRFGAGYFIGCDQHPRCKYIAKTLYGDDDDADSPDVTSIIEEPKLLGLHPVSEEKILIKNGPYGYYVQLGEDRKNFVPKRSSVSHIKDMASVTLEVAVELLRYPVTLGNHPDDGLPVILKLAKNGFVVKHRRNFFSIPKNVLPNTVTLEKAMKYLSSKDVRRSGRPKGPSKVEEVVEAV